MNYFIIGPSAIGKTTLINEIRNKHDDIATFVMDDIICEWGKAQEYPVTTALGVYNLLRSPKKFFTIGIECLNLELEKNNKPHAIIDMGSGFLLTELTYEFLQKEQCVALVATPEIAYERSLQRKVKSATFEAYNKAEFSDIRKRLFNNAKYSINTDEMTPNDVLSRLQTIIFNPSSLNTMDDDKSKSVELFTDPNKHALRIGLTLGETSTVRGYQGFSLSRDSIKVADNDKGLATKNNMISPLMANPWFKGKTVLDLGANAAYFCFLSLLKGAEYADAVEIDKNYIKLVRDLIEHNDIPNMEIHDRNVMDYHRSADVTFAYALIHWIYSCTSDYGSLDQSIKKLSDLTRGILVVEWIDNEDSAIKFFNHTDYNKKIINEPYNRENFEKALTKHFVSWKVLGEVKPTRVVYVGFKTQEVSETYTPIL